MRAVVLTEPNRLQVEDVEIPPLAPHEVLVRVTATGLCHSDLHGLREPARFKGPIILGHEVAGVVEETGSQVDGLRAGDRVIGSWVPACGACFWCVGGQEHLCRELWPTELEPRLPRSDGSLIRRATGLGAFAEQMVVSQRSLVKVETDVSDALLALIGCGVTTGVGAVLNTAAVTPGSSVLVLGCGGVGLSVVQGARIVGAATIIAVDPVADKRTAATHAGATSVIDPAQDDVVDAVLGLTAGRGADYTFEVSGRAQSLPVAWSATRRGGTIVPVGAQGADVLYPWTAYEQLFLEKNVLGCLYGSAQMRRDFPRIVGFVESGQLDLDAMVTGTLSLDQVEQGLEAIEGGQVIRQIMIP